MTSASSIAGFNMISANKFSGDGSLITGLTLSQHSDCAMSNPNINQILTYNGSKWTNSSVLSNTSGVFTPQISGVTNCVITSIQPLYYMQQGNFVTCCWACIVTVNAAVTNFNFNATVPINPTNNNTFTTNYQASGNAACNTKTQTIVWSGFVQSIAATNTVCIGMRSGASMLNTISGFEVYIQYSYNLTN